MDNANHAVHVRGAYKQYGKKKHANHVLTNLYMTVPKGIIYGLLGASGCGKTTLLSCVVGRRRLDAGDIWVLGGRPGHRGSGIPGRRVGYMPQELALYGEFTISETMLYFGWIAGMKSRDIRERRNFLIELLDLPFKDRLVKDLSGGQQRRVSFAAALVHDPELLILDEPTVGVDPLLRANIWSYLIEIPKDGNKTVIMTTHYIEEAKQAHLVGIMRNGKFLAEESPKVLLAKHGCTALEDVFLKLCKKEGGSKELLISGSPEYIVEKKSSFTRDIVEACGNCVRCREWTTRGKMKALLFKNFIKMWRNIGVMLFVFALPAMQVVLFCSAIGGDPRDLKLGIVSDETGYTSSTYINCSIIPENCTFLYQSCRYLDALDNKRIIKRYYPDTETAKIAVKEGRSWGVVYFPEPFSAALKMRLAGGMAAMRKSLDWSNIEVWLDMSEACGNCVRCTEWTTRGKMKALLFKNFIKMWRNIGVMLFVFALPALQVILFCSAIGGDPRNLKMAIVNDEIGYTNSMYINCSDAPKTGCPIVELSCRYLDALSTVSIVKRYYPDTETAKLAVKEGRLWGVVYFQKFFSEALTKRFMEGINANKITLDRSNIQVWLDMSDQQIGIVLQRDLTVAYQDFIVSLLKLCGVNEKIASIPISFEEPIYGSYKPSFTDFVAPGGILTIIFFLAVALTSLALIAERSEGLLDRSFVVGVGPGEIIFSHVLTQCVIMFGQTAFVLIFMMLVFEVTCIGSIYLVIIITILQGLCGMCYGFVISAVCELERNAIQLALGSFYPVILLSGIIWPVEGMPTILRHFSSILPLTLATSSLRSIMARGWGILEPVVYLGFASTIAWIFIFLSVTIIVLKIKRG